MTSATIQPFCGKSNINTGCYDGFRVCPRNFAERNTTFRIHEKNFRFIWKSDGISFDKAMKELKHNFKVSDNVISDKHFKSLVKYEYKPKKVQSQVTNMVVYDIEAFNIDKAVPYASCIYRLNKISGKYNQDLTQRKYENCG